MTLFEPEDDEPEWRLGVYPIVVPEEPSGERLSRIQDARDAGARLWLEVQKEMVKRA